jgi:hypothetical protein
MSKDDLATSALLEFLNAAEAGIVATKRLIQEGKGISQVPSRSWDPTRIKWEQAQGASGPYERSEDMNNSDFKLLLKDLAEHNGKLSAGCYFYWVFKNGSTIGRKHKRGTVTFESQRV